MRLQRQPWTHAPPHLSALTGSRRGRLLLPQHHEPVAEERQQRERNPRDDKLPKVVADGDASRGAVEDEEVHAEEGLMSCVNNRSVVDWGEKSDLLQRSCLVGR